MNAYLLHRSAWITDEATAGMYQFDAHAGLSSKSGLAESTWDAQEYGMRSQKVKAIHGF
jgi:hypothetical protein